MAWSRASDLIALAVAAFAAAALPAAADDPPTQFSRQITALTGDWQAEDWRNGTIKTHPDKYTWQSDTHLTLLPEEPAEGRTALEIARAHFDGFSLDDDTLDPTVIDMTGAKEVSAGVIAKSYTWVYGFDTNFSMFGAVLRSDGRAIPYHANCEIPEPDDDPTYSYGEEDCLRAIGTILIALQGSSGISLFMPDAEAPLTIPGWRNSYSASGVSVAVNANFYGTRKATLMVSPPLDIAAADLPQMITGFSDQLVDEFDDQIDKHPGIATWVGSMDDPWIRREFPQAFDGPSTIMAGTQKGRNGKTYLIGIRCPNSNWQESCAHGVDQARQQVRSGILEERRQKIIAAGQETLPENGATADEVLGVFLQGTQSWASGTFQYTMDGPILFRNGDASACFNGPLGAIVIADSKRTQPECWGSWTRSGDTIDVTWNDGDATTISAEGAIVMVGGDKDTRIDGHFRFVATGGSPIMGSSYMSEENYYFSADGTFSSDTASSFSVTAGNPISPDAIASGASSGAGPQGRYLIDGYDMQLTFPDGRVKWVGFAQDKDDADKTAKESLLIDGTYFFRDDD